MTDRDAKHSAAPLKANKGGMTALMAACGAEETTPAVTAVVQHMLAAASTAQCLPALLRAHDHHGSTALHFACRGGLEGAVAALVDAGADPLIRNKVSFLGD
jgi:ankyrin repeat protein